MNVLEKMKTLSVYALLLGGALLSSCSDDDAPEAENEEEVITDVALVFTSQADGSIVTATAVDPDGDGAESLTIADEITLSANTTYTLTYDILNALDEDDVEDITEEIEEEAVDHQFYFSFTTDAFTSPSGDGNIDDATDDINYEDEDDNGNPIGLETSWTTGAALSDGTFRVVLKHQPDVKSSTSTFDDGDTDIDLTFVLNIE